MPTTHRVARVAALLCCAVLRPHHPQAGPSRSLTADSSPHRTKEEVHTQTTCAPCAASGLPHVTRATPVAAAAAFEEEAASQPAAALPTKPSHHAKKVRRTPLCSPALYVMPD